jgi:ribose/xylose/arabinose/galactoside ABC-type transport system permease subunit
MNQKLLRLRFSSFKNRLSFLFYRSPNFAGKNNIGAIIGLFLLILVFSLLSVSFRQISNLVLLAKSAAITIGIVAVGQTVVMIAGGIDLSVSSVIAITGLITASLMKFGWGLLPPLEGNWCYLAIGIGWLIGLLIGAGQGFLITRFQMPAFIVTLGTMVGLRGLSVAISNSAPINALPDEFKWFSDGKVGIIPAPVLILLAVYFSTAYMLRKTKMGRYCHAIGGNETAARLAGIAVDRYRVYFYAFSGLLASLTGTILISYIDAAVYTNGDGFQFSSVAAAIIGGTSLTGGIGGIWGTLTGVLILATVPSGMVMLNVPSWWRDVVTGIVILLAVFIDINRQHTRKNAIPVDAIQTIPGEHYLYKLLSELFYRIKKITGTSLCRIYLVYRETDELVPQDALAPEKNSALPGKSKIVLEAKESGNAVLIQDLARSGYQNVVPIQADVQCALALPLIYHDRCIGVIELQSPGVAVFKDSTVETLRAIVLPALSALEDAWLFESGWLVRQIREALRHLWDDLYLGRMDLAGWALANLDPHRSSAIGARGETLRELLVKTIESLKSHDVHDESHETRYYRILQLTYIQERAVDQIVRETHISRRQYFYDLKNSIEILSDMLIRDRYQATVQHSGSVTEMADRLPHYSSRI